MKKSFLFLLMALVSAVPYAQSAAPGQAGYEDQSAAKKQEILQGLIEASEYKALPQWTGREPLSMFLLAFNPFRSVVRAFFNVTLEVNSDILPDGRKKGIHTYGSTAAFEFVPDPGSPFTGLYQGAKYGYLRLSLAAKPDGVSTIPGIGVKFLVDGAPSLNFVAMYSLDGQKTYNFFAHGFSTFIDAPSSGPLKILAKAFGTATADPTKVDSAYLANIRADGTSVALPVAPERLLLVPESGSLAFSDAPHEVRDDLFSIPSGSTLYRVYGIKAGASDKVFIGSIVTTSRFVSSKFGDEKLFFRHQRFNGK